MTSGCDVESLVHHPVVATALLRYPGAARGEPVEEVAVKALFGSDGGWYPPEVSALSALTDGATSCLRRLEAHQQTLAAATPMSETFLDAQLSSLAVFKGLWGSEPGSHPVVVEDGDRMAWFTFQGCAWEREECFFAGVVCERAAEVFDCFPSGDGLPLLLGERWRAGDAATVLAEWHAEANWTEAWSTLVYGGMAAPACVSCQPAQTGAELASPAEGLAPLLDEQPGTAACWPEGEAAFEVQLAAPTRVGHLGVLGGHFGSESSLRAHGRVKRLVLSVDGGAPSTHLIADPAASPRPLGELQSAPVQLDSPLQLGERIRVEVTEVYPGARGDVCISDLWLNVLPGERK